MIKSRVLKADRRAVDEAIVLANEGKVTSKNAWDVKILDGLDSTVEAYMKEDETIDAYTQFTKAASIVESGAKVWAHRVEFTFLMTTKMQQKLMRSDWNEQKETSQSDSQNDKKQFQGKSLLYLAADKMSSKMKEAPPALVQNNSEISLMNKCVLSQPVEEGNVQNQHAKSSLLSVDPLFKATAARLGGVGSQGASGLLMNTAYMGAQGNILLGFEQYIKESKNCFNKPRDHYGVEVNLRPFQLMDRSPPSTIPEAGVHQGRVSVTLDDFEDDGMNFDAEEETVHDIGSQLLSMDGRHSTSNTIAPQYVEPQPRLSTTSVLNDISSFYDQDWIPILPENSNAVKQGSILEQVRKESALNTHSTQCDDSKTPKPRKRIRFQYEDFMSSWIADDNNHFYQEKLSKLNTSPFAFVNAHGKECLSPCIKRSKSKQAPHMKKIVDHDYALSISSTKGLMLPLQDTTMGIYLKSLDNVNCYLQPFCTKESHWSWLSRRKYALPSTLTEEAVFTSENMISIDDVEGIEDTSDHNFEGSVEASLSMPNLNSRFQIENEGCTYTDDVMGLVNEPCSVVPVLKIQSVTKPTFVDVSRLRSSMWNYIEKALKKVQETNDSNSEGLTVQFSEIVFSMIKNREMQSISHDGTLSPAFFYFSLLFLANEKGLRLSQSPDLNDVFISTS
ncbi:chromosome-associated protein H [Perkinsela sp. CCAP 1560/4]|nr:chromosome-associated protein H [Perkinsela sp. CCAP 1560/4]|eukprot:KNH07648.1 chromosome-associated protein H [Perkinsela sp. CCAP 1560/4]